MGKFACHVQEEEARITSVGCQGMLYFFLNA